MIQIGSNARFGFAMDASSDHPGPAGGCDTGSGAGSGSGSGTGEAGQATVLAFLGDPATHGGAPPVRIDTHAAAVFLAGPRALKIKRAVKFPFLDFSTLERRKAACAAEILANRPFAPHLYRGVRAIVRRADGTLALEPDGSEGAEPRRDESRRDESPVEWAVEMRRFDETRTLDRLADRGALDDTLADALGRVLAAAHAKAAAVAPAGGTPWLAALRRWILQNTAEFLERPNLFPPEEVAALETRSAAALAALSPLLAARERQGLVRRGHGDLHLGNIALIDGEPVPFDALEFDPQLATGDLLYDLAFLLMDLWQRGFSSAANVVLNRYLVETRRAADLDGLAALPLFLSVRAAIRAKVTAARPAPADAPDAPEAALAIAASAQKYFRLACALIAPPPPVLVAIGGLSGTGKSAVAKALAEKLGAAPGAVVLRSDVLRKLMRGVAEHDRLPPEAYGPGTTARVYAALAAAARRTLAAGHAAIVDAVAARPDERAAFRKAAESVGVPFVGLFLEADLATRVARVTARRNDASDADAAVAEHQEAYDLGPLDWQRIDAGGTPAETLARAQDAVSRYLCVSPGAG